MTTVKTDPPQGNDENRFELTIRVETRFSAERSRIDSGVYAFAYTVYIQNTGKHSAQLISRRWTILDAMGATQEVRGLGVVGQQPLIQPGQEFEYSSWASIPTPAGTIKGSFFFVTEDDARFDVPVPEFGLSLSKHLH